MPSRCCSSPLGLMLRALPIGMLLGLSSVRAEPEGPLVLEAPAEGAIVGATVKVQGHVNTEAIAVGVLRINGQGVPFPENRFETDLKAAAEGAFKIRAQFAVVGKPATTVERTVTVDLTPPTLEVDEPAAEVSVHTTSEVLVHGEALDPHLLVVRMNGQSVAVDDKGHFHESFLLPPQGDVRVVIEALDVAGNRSERVRVLRAGAPTPGGPAPPAAGPDADPARRPPPLRPPPATYAPEIVLAEDGRRAVRLRDDWGEHPVPEPYLDANSLASLRAALRRVPWVPPAGAGAVPPPARPLVLECADDTLWERVAALLRLSFQPGVAPSQVVLRGRDAQIPVRLDPPPTEGGAQPIAIRVHWGGRDARRPENHRTAFEGLGERVSLLRTPDGMALFRRRTLEELRDRIAQRRSGLASYGLVAPESTQLDFLDILTACEAFAAAGVSEVFLALKTPMGSYSYFGESRPLETAPRPAAVPGVRPAPGAAPAAPPPPSPGPPDAEASAFASRVDRLRGRAAGWSEPAEQSVVAALRWLAAHVAPDGGWEAEGFPDRCAGGPPAPSKPDGAGLAVHDVGVTGLALAAFLAAGYGPRGAHEFAPVVRRGLAWLRAQQDDEGCFPHRVEEHFVYGHAVATMAMVEAYGSTGSRPYGTSAQRGLDFIARARNPDGVWRYGVRTGENDGSVTAWMVMAIRSAEVVNAGIAARGKGTPLALDPKAPAAWSAWIADATTREGAVVYGPGGLGPARPTDVRYREITKDYVDLFPREKSEGSVAWALLLRLLAGETSAVRPVEQGITRCLRRPPVWKDDGSIDFDYWHFASLALFQAGGLHWKTWNGTIVPVLTKNQRQDGGPCGSAGSWDPLDAWGFAGGRIYSTAMGALILATPNRYERLVAPK